MKSVLTILTTAFLILNSGSLFAQGDDILNEEITVGLNLNTNAGLIGGGVFRYSKRHTEHAWNTFSVEIVNVKHKKEERFSSALSGKTFVRGKLNYLLSIRPQYAREIVLFNKYPEEGIHVNAVLGIGPSFGLVKPYFIEYSLDPEGEQFEVVPYNPDLHEDGKVLGSGGFFTGFDQSNIQMGLHLKAALNFEFGRFDSVITGVETGLTVEGFAKRVDLYPTDDNSQLFSAVFLTFYYGSRY